MACDERYMNSVDAAKAMQYVAISLVSVVLVLVVAAACTASPASGRLGLAAGITLGLFSVFQIVAFSLVIDVTGTCEPASVPND